MASKDIEYYKDIAREELDSQTLSARGDQAAGISRYDDFGLVEVWLIGWLKVRRSS